MVGGGWEKGLSSALNPHTSIEMNQLNTAQPTHDEIALHAFLIWEKEGRQPGREQTYWLQAETQLRLTRQQRVEAEAKTARVWPPQAASTPKLATARAITPKAAAPTAPKLAPARDTAVKALPARKPARKPASSASARKSLAQN